MKRLAGILIILLGVWLMCWIGYNVFIERLPEATGSPFLSFILVLGFFYVGIKWIKGKSA